MTAPVSARSLPRPGAAGWSVVLTVTVVGCALLVVALTGSSLSALGGSVLRVLWLLPALIGLHLSQLLVAALGWRSLFVGQRPGVGVFYRLRVIREGIDSLLPVAQIGGEIVGARLLAKHRIAPGTAGASVIVDVTVEFLTQVAFLFAGIAALAWLARRAPWDMALQVALAAAAAAALLLALRFGLLRVLDGLLRRIAQRWPALGGAAPGRLHEAALGFFRQRWAMRNCVLLHLVAWGLGTAETWAVLHALGVPVSPVQALVIESLGMAARSAGFAIPAALGAQEGGFMLAVAAAGVPEAAAVPLVLLKRLREVSVGLIGLALWRFGARWQRA